MKTKLRFNIVLLALGLAILPAAVYSSAQDDSLAQAGYSHVRIVRLSFVEGTVTLQRPDLTDWAAAPANTPIQEGFKLSTAENSFTEVEFENTSTARLGQLSLLDFNQLVASPSGGKVNRLTLEQGYATFTVIPEGVETFEVKAQDTTIALAAATATRFRVDIDQGSVRVEVFKGAADVSSPSGQVTLTKNMVVDITPGAGQAFNTSQGITKDAWDQWVDERDNQQATVRNSPRPNGYSSGSSSVYGWNDLSNYGDWSYFSGNGYGWVPGGGLGWSPFSDGRWCWYPGFGYTWISNEPWGWLPYHYGGWSFQPGFGWAWFPGNLGAWSPGNVNWSQGEGWVGWSPQGPQGISGVASANCLRGQTCGRIIVRPVVVQEGRPVNRSIVMRGEFADGQPIKKLDLPPSPLGMLPGAPSKRTAFAGSQPSVPAQRIGTAAQVSSGNNSVVVGESTGARPSSVVARPANESLGARRGPGAGHQIEFNPETGRYENNPRMEPTSANGQAAPTSPQNAGEARSPGNRSGAAAPSQQSPANIREAVGPAEAAPTGRQDSPAPVARPSHSVAPSYQPRSASSPHSSSRASSSSSSNGDGGWSSGGGRSVGGIWGSSGSSAGGAPHSSAGSGGGRAGGGGSSHGGGPHH